MNEVDNPYVPSAGVPPPALVGREHLLNRIKTALTRMQAGRYEKSLMPIGLRGVGKTVLLNRFLEEAERQGFLTAFFEASENGRLPVDLGAQLRKVLIRLDRGAQISSVVKRALRIFKSFSVTAGVESLRFAIDVDPERGSADSGDLTLDLTDLLVAVGEAAREKQTPVLIAIDEIQYLTQNELAALIMAVHRVSQKALPVMVVGAGLPQLAALAGEAKSYAERLFDFPAIGPLSAADAKRAIAEPARVQGADFTDEALSAIAEITEGYPYFIQAWAYRVWNHAQSSPIQLNDVLTVREEVLDYLDRNFFRVRFDRLTPREQNYMRAMAELGPGPHRSGDIAKVLGVRPNAVGPLRDGLIKKGMIYSPKYGDTAFTVPLFDAFMRRAMPEFQRKGHPSAER